MTLARTPIFAVLVGLLAIGMLAVSLQAASEANWRDARGFLYPAIFCGFAGLSIAVLFARKSEGQSAEAELGSLLTIWLLLPFFAALPLFLLTPSIGRPAAVFEMMAALTTTGGSVYSKASSASDAIHLWRGMIGWLGGLITLIAAYVILAPRRLGGFEVAATAAGLSVMQPVDLRVEAAPFESRMMRALKTILPIYLGLTLCLGIAFNALDKPGLISAVHAMSVVSTSGITPVDGGFAASGSIGAEVVAALFMVLAASRVLYVDASQAGQNVSWRTDPELRLMGTLVVLAVSVLFLRHWVGALTLEDGVEPGDGLMALWGAIFTTVSFITTTGFESSAWESARDWSGLHNPGLILLALCTIGGSAATTAGGVKLIRAYALIRHGSREIGRIAQPHSVAGSGAGLRTVRRDGAFIAWTFLMLFILALMTTVLGLTLSGMTFTNALIASVAALSNTGPAFAQISENGNGFVAFSALQQFILALAMVLGRIETLAVIALFSTDGWWRTSARSKKTGKS